MSRLFSELFSHWLQRWIGAGPILGGALLGLGGWFFLYALQYWRLQRLYSVIMAGVSAALFGAVFYVDWELGALLKCAIIGLLICLSFRYSLRTVK